jgi:hypothetical protein
MEIKFPSNDSGEIKLRILLRELRVVEKDMSLLWELRTEQDSRHRGHWHPGLAEKAAEVIEDLAKQIRSLEQVVEQLARAILSS